MAEYSNEETFELTFTPDPALASSPGAKHLCTKLDSFRFDGPNGNHLVLVFEPLGRSFEEVIELCSRGASDPEYDPGVYGTREWSAVFGREASRQIALGLEYLHAHGVMHRDIQPGNIMLGLTYDVDLYTKDQVQYDVWEDKAEDDGDESNLDEEAWSEMNVRRLKNYLNILERSDGEPLAPNHPPYTVAAISLNDRLKFGPPPPTDFTVKLIDLGSACKFEDCNDGKTPYPIDIRAPEIVVGLPYNEKADVWALACTIFRIVTMEPLIPLWMTADAEATDDEHLKNMIDRFGKLPDSIVSSWIRANKHINAEGKILEPDEYNPDSCQFGDVWQGIRLAKPKDMSETEAKMFCDLLVKMLDYDINKRLSMKEVLKHPWFTAEKFTE